MNFKFINRKQALGIIRPTDYTDWAEAENNKSIRRFHPKTSSRLWREFNAEDMRAHREWFDSVIDEQSFEFQHKDTEDSIYTKKIQSTYTKARNAGILVYMMDTRPISELGEDLSDLELADKAVTECGCNPINPYWLEYSPSDGRKTLKVVFEISVAPYGPNHARPTGSNGLADQFLAFFDESVRFFGNSCYAPWEGHNSDKPYVQSKNLQTLHEVDFGLVLVDDKRIGFLLFVGDYQ